MNVKKAIANIIAKTVLKTVNASCGAASYYGVYQPKEPANIKKLLK